jgi:hypothetical protein
VVTLSRPYYRLEFPIGTSDGIGAGAYSLELWGEAGVLLFHRLFEPTGYDDDPEEGPLHFRELVPWQEGTQRVVIKREDTVLHVTDVSPHAPQVTLLEPNGGEYWPPFGEQTVTWMGQDMDGDSLHYTLQYSTDGWETWKAVALDLTDESYVLDAGLIPGGEAALRVIASDGVNTAQDASDDVFYVEGKPPFAQVLYPLDGSTERPGHVVMLEGSATDLEEGPLMDGSRFTWHSSLEGHLGVGRRLYIDHLSPGWHTITMSVNDSDGFVSEDSATVLIGHELYLPMTGRSMPTFGSAACSASRQPAPE